MLVNPLNQERLIPNVSCLPNVAVDAYFVSDVHLNAEEPEITTLFLRFLEHCAHAKSLFILGDLFQYWLDDNENSPAAIQVAQALSNLAEKDTQIYFVHGNRDFLLGEQYAKKCQMSLLPSSIAIETSNQSYVIAHGDEYCTLDTGYQRFRRIVRQPGLIYFAQMCPLWFKRSIANLLRSKSKRSKSQKTLAEMDCQVPAMLKALNHYNTTILIHGHTHTLGSQSFADDNGIKYTRHVLGDWQTSPGNYLHLSDKGEFTFSTYS